MKLYTTASSERASKGQGGNQFMRIHVQDESEETLVRITILPSDDEDALPVAKIEDGTYEILRQIEDSAHDRAEEILKGKKQ